MYKNEMYPRHNEGKSVATERFIRTLSNKIYEYMTSISKNAYIDKLDDIVNKYNNTCHRTIKMKPVDIKTNIYINFDKENNMEGPKFKVVDHVRISKYKNTFAESYVHNFALTEKKSLERFTKKNCKKQIKKSLELKK